MSDDRISVPCARRAAPPGVRPAARVPAALAALAALAVAMAAPGRAVAASVPQAADRVPQADAGRTAPSATVPTGPGLPQAAADARRVPAGDMGVR